MTRSADEMAERIARVASLLRQRNAIDAELAVIIGRPPEKGHLGEWLASQLFDIELEHSATQAGYDGRFRSGPHAGRTVNIKWYATRDGLLDINPQALPDVYLVLSGPPAAAATSRGGTRPWLVSDAFLFDAQGLIARLASRGVRIGTATSLRREEWEKARIAPAPEIEAAFQTLRTIGDTILE